VGAGPFGSQFTGRITRLQGGSWLRALNGGDVVDAFSQSAG
jgi:hypothetical protein